MQDDVCYRASAKATELGGDSAEKWAVMKKGRKTAVRLYNSQVEAEMPAVSIQGSYLEHRPADPIRCNYFCSVNEFCNQYQEERVRGNGS